MWHRNCCWRNRGIEAGAPPILAAPLRCNGVAISFSFVFGRHPDAANVLGRHFAIFEAKNERITPEDARDVQNPPENALGVRISPENAAVSRNRSRARCVSEPRPKTRAASGWRTASAAVELGRPVFRHADAPASHCCGTAVPKYARASGACATSADRG